MNVGGVGCCLKTANKHVKLRWQANPHDVSARKPKNPQLLLFSALLEHQFLNSIILREKKEKGGESGNFHPSVADEQTFSTLSFPPRFLFLVVVVGELQQTQAFPDVRVNSHKSKHQYNSVSVAPKGIKEASPRIRAYGIVRINGAAVDVN